MIKEIGINQSPIFIVGFPRSGTTYLQSLLGTQEGVISFPETHFFNKAVGHFSIDHKLSTSEMTQVLNVLEDKNEVKFDRGFWTENSPVDQKDLFEKLIFSLGENQKVNLSKPKLAWIEKTPAHALFLSKIISYYPNAKIISIVRNPLNAIDSYFRKLIVHRKPHHDLAQEFISTYDAVRDFKEKHPKQVFEVRYESLLENRGVVISEVMNFLEMKLDSTRLDNYQDVAAGLITKQEKWKEANLLSSDDYKNKKHALSLKHTLQLQYILRPYLSRYKYPLEKTGLLKMYSVYRNLKG